MIERLQSAFAALDAATAGTADERTPLIKAKARALMCGYHARWKDVHFDVIGVEEVISSDLWNPKTGRTSRSFVVSGKVDVRAADGPTQIFIDHKTCGEDIAPDAPYWRQLTVEGQLNHYLLLEWLNGRKIDAAMWDVVRKPGISPKSVPRKSKDGENLEKITMTGKYYGVELSPDCIVRLQASERETLEMYEIRLAHDCTHERSEWYFQRRMIPRTDAELLEYAKELWGWSQDLLHARREKLWPRQSKACMLFNRPCKFLGICSGYDADDSDKWQRKQFVHKELPVIQGSDGRDILTNSRIQSLICKRKHYYEYELGIERLDEEEAESLYFGNLWHIAQDAWWSYKSNTGEQNGNAICDSQPAIGVGTAAAVDR